MSNNINLNGDDARALMMALATSSASIPAETTIKLWSMLSEISQVQPPNPITQTQIKN